MIAWLKRLFRRAVRPRADAVTFDTRTGWWGNRVEWFDTGTHRVVGWTEPLPRAGDLLKSPMKSGRVGLFVFIKVERCGDPPDMFFGTVSPIGYEEEASCRT